MPDESISTLRSVMRLALAGLMLLAAAWFLSGCLPVTVPQYPEPDLTTALPSSWTPVMFDSIRLLSRGHPWNEINIDGDAAPEYLIFFTYDSGQVGAAIYDLQIGSNRLAGPTPVPQSNEPPGTYIPYRLEPDFFACGGRVGYIAPPGATANELNFQQVRRSDAEGTDAGANTDASSGTDTAANNELEVIGSNTVLTIVWWRDERYGYGVTQVGAGFQLVQPTYEQGNDALPIESIIGLDPHGAVNGRLGRSLLCRATLYTRDLFPERPGCAPTGAQKVDFAETDRGIVFCHSLPPVPAYPEGTVLAFLKPENFGTLAMTPDDLAQHRSRFMTQTVGGPDPETYLGLASFDAPGSVTATAAIVQDLLYTGTVPATAQEWIAAGGTVTTKVCAWIANSARQGERRLLLFDLIYEPPHQVSQDDTTTLTAGQWLIVGITNESGRAASCRDLFVQLADP